VECDYDALYRVREKRGRVKTYETDGPTGIYVMYLCNCVPSADITHEQGKTYITVPDKDDELLRSELSERGYTYSLYREE
jgi:hypothetical protein